MNGMEQVRTPETVAAEIRALTASMLNDVIEIGRRMTEVKEMLPHGSFGDWIKENTGYSSSTANNFMQLYREYGEAQSSLFGTGAKSQTIGNLSYSKALALLAVPAEERESFAEEADAEHITVRELKEKIEARERELARANEEAGKAIEKAEKLEKQLKDADEDWKNQREQISELADELGEARRTVEELKARPVEVAVEKVDASEEQIAQAKKEAAAEWEKTVKELKEKEKKKREALQEQLQAAEKALTEEKGKGPDTALTAEVEALRKKLSMSSQEMTEFRLRFSAWQESYAEMRTALAKVPEEQRDRCEAAVKAVLKNWEE